MKLFFHLMIFTVLLSGCGSERPADEALQQLLASPLLTPSEGMPGACPDHGCRRLRVRPIGGSLASVLNDVNDAHIAAAEASGIEPIESMDDAWRQSRRLVRIASCRNYYLDSLTHSYPYLTPEADSLLREIGTRFNDTLRARGGGAYRIKVTSVLRTDATVRRLRRVNRNATANSAHRYGTTFDISYAKFVCDDSTATRRTNEDLKNLLGEILYDLRREGRCLVKHERRQGCFHITSTGS